jgi:hypothetical protein
LPILYKKYRYLPQENLPFYWKPFHLTAGYCSTSNQCCQMTEFLAK